MTDEDIARPDVVPQSDAGRVAAVLDAGGVVALPGVGGYFLAAKAGVLEAEERLTELAADPEGPHYVAADRAAASQLASGWNEEIDRLLERCWPGPLELFVSRATAAGQHAAESPEGGWAIVIGTPEGRALRKLCREHGPWRAVPLVFADAAEVAQAFDVRDVSLVVDGGRCEGPSPTVVDATVTPLRVLREGALPANFVEGAALMAARRRISMFRRRHEDDE